MCDLNQTLKEIDNVSPVSPQAMYQRETPKTIAVTRSKEILTRTENQTWHT